MNCVSSIKKIYLQNNVDVFVYKVKYAQLFSFSWYYTLGVKSEIAALNFMSRFLFDLLFAYRLKDY